MIGQVIGCYRIVDKLGEGGMGVVYKAMDTGLDRLTAMKVLNTDFSKNPELVERFRAEAKAQANLNHTNLATLYAFLLQDGVAFMVMEFVDGETFEQIIRRRGPIPEQEAIPMFRQALLGIGYAHRAGIIHRDIKPSNLMLNNSGIVKVMDFGIAKVMGTRGMTRTGTQMGTVAYMSPEQIQNRAVDSRSDIYELGVTLYEMLTGRLPFESDSDFQVMADHVGKTPPPPSQIFPQVSKGVEAAVLKSLEKNPDARFQTVEEFGAALEHMNSFTAFPVVTTPERPVAPPSRPPLPPTVPATGQPPMQRPAQPPMQHGSQPPWPHPAQPGAQPPYQPTVPATAPPAARPPLAPTVPATVPGYVSGSVPANVPGTVPAGGFTQPTIPVATQSPGQPAAQSRQLRTMANPPAPAGSGKKWIIIGVVVAVLAVGTAVAIYQMNSPVPGGGGTDSGGSAGGSSGGGSSLPASQGAGSGGEITLGGGSSPALNLGDAPPPAPHSAPHSVPAAPAMSAGQMYSNAQAALRAHRYFEPVNNSALFWAIQARKAGSPEGKALENQILEVYRKQVNEYMQQGNYRSALGLVQAMLKFYPGDPGLHADQKKLQAALAASH